MASQELLDLLNKGVALTEKHLKIFKIWGVTEADIESYDKEKVEEEAYSLLNEEDMEKIDSMLKTRFFDFSSNEVMAEIYRITKKQKIKSYIKGIESR